MVKRKGLIVLCALTVLAATWSVGQVSAQPQQAQGIARPRHSHDAEFILQRRSRRITNEQRMAAAARYAAAHGQATGASVNSGRGK